jgi:hypothetical protein
MQCKGTAPSEMFSPTQLRINLLRPVKLETMTDIRII